MASQRRRFNAYAAALLLAALVAPRGAAGGGGAPTLLYSLPAALDLDDPSVVRVNPTSTPQDATLVDFWRLGAGPLVPSPGWDLADWTGAAGLGRGSQRGLQPAARVDGSTAM